MCRIKEFWKIWQSVAVANESTEQWSRVVYVICVYPRQLKKEVDILELDSVNQLHSNICHISILSRVILFIDYQENYVGM